MGAGGEQVVNQPQSARGGHPPGQHVLTPNPILEFSLSLQDENLAARTSQRRGERRTREPAAHGDGVEGHLD